MVSSRRIYSKEVNYLSRNKKNCFSINLELLKISAVGKEEGSVDGQFNDLKKILLFNMAPKARSTQGAALEL